MKLIPLTQGFSAIVDDDKFEFLSQWKWYARKGTHTWYAGRCVRVSKTKKVIYMHRVILNNPLNEIDHIDSNGLNNQLHNLRVTTKAQNQFNRGLSMTNKSGFRGVYFNKRAKKWFARIEVNKKCHWLGSFPTAEEAGKAYDDAARRLHGDFYKNPSLKTSHLTGL
jgi:hypothetical protein